MLPKRKFICFDSSFVCNGHIRRVAVCRWNVS